MPNILIVEDDPKTAELLQLYLEKDGHATLTAHDGAAALDLARQRPPDLVLLDLMLPLIDGLDICRLLRASSRVPIIMLTARSTEDDTLSGLDAGADDYITKPFSPREVVARVRTVLRRAGEQHEHSARVLRFGELLIDLERHEVRRADEIIRVTPREFKLLAAMALKPGKAFSRFELLQLAFGYDYEGLDRTIDVHLMNLRKKIERDPAHPEYIQTVYGVGYKFGGGDHVA